MLQLSHIKKAYKDKKVLNDIDYLFEEGNIYSVLAGNKAGKTTLLKCISGECIPDEGSVKARANQVIYYASSHGDFPRNISGETWIKYLCSLKKGTKKPDIYMDRVGLDRSIRRVAVREYNPEDRRRLQLCALIVLKPHIMLFDEMLDDCSEEFLETFMDIISEECTRRIVIVATKQLNIAKRLAPDIIMLNNGMLNSVSANMLDVPEIKQAIADILGDNANDSY